MAERLRHLMPAELEVAIQHAVRTNHVAEQHRERLRDATDLDTLREILRDVGLPREDIEKAIDTLPAALAAHERSGVEARERRQARVWIAGGVVAIVACVGALVVGMVHSGHDSNFDPIAAAPTQRRVPAPPVAPPAPPVVAPVAIDERHDAAEALRATGLTVLESLDQAQMMAISEGRATSLTALFSSPVPKIALVVTRADCHMAADLAKLLDDDSGAVSMKNWRAHVEAMRVDVATGRRLAGETEEYSSLHIDQGIGCRVAATGAAKKLGARLKR